MNLNNYSANLEILNVREQEALTIKAARILAKGRYDGFDRKYWEGVYNSAKSEMEEQTNALLRITRPVYNM